MRLYAGSSSDFISDTVHNRIADQLKAAYFSAYRRQAAPPEVAAWRNSLRAVAQVFQTARLEDHGVLLEYELPMSSRRLDCLVTGRNSADRDNAYIIELKQWERCEDADGDKVVTFTGGDLRDVLHPSVQVGQYKRYLEDCHSAFYADDNAIGLSACAYLHNYVPAENDPILSPKFNPVRSQYPLFLADDVDRLTTALRAHVGSGKGLPVLDRIQRGKYRASKKLLDHVGAVLEGRPEYVLLDEQLVVFERVMSAALKGRSSRHKVAVIIRGGPGTGKSVIALNLLAALSRHELNTHYVTGSRAFTNTLRKIVGARASAQMRFFNSYMAAEFEDISVMICDEAHRIRETSNDRYTPRAKRSSRSQIEELFHAAKVAVFFIDDRQVVRPGEVGSAERILETARQQKAQIFDFKLDAQFRCAGSEGFVNWVDNTLEIERTANVLWSAQDKFDFRIVSSPETLEAQMNAKLTEGFTARVAAGFCWPWSDPLPDGTLVPDVSLGNFQRPWNAKPEARRLARDIPPSHLWAYDPRGAKQIGCVYTAQGFEFDYIGVIFGPDLVYRHGQGWIGCPDASNDTVVRRSKGSFVDLVKNTYRVLFTRGLKGCYVYFTDKETEQFVRSRMEGAPEISFDVRQELGEPEIRSDEPLVPFDVVATDAVVPFENAIPCFVDVKAAAGAFLEGLQSDECIWVRPPEGFSPKPDYFLVRVVGESMNRRIPNGSWCLFRASPQGTREGRTVLVQHRDIQDPDTGSCTVKIYHSNKAKQGDAWRHESITLSPLSTDPAFKPIELYPDGDSELRVIGELLAVVPH